jgi:hypothetical protein
MWNKFVSSTGKVCLTKRVFTANGPTEEKFWFSPEDSDWDEMVKFCESKGL